MNEIIMFVLVVLVGLVGGYVFIMLKDFFTNKYLRLRDYLIYDVGFSENLIEQVEEIGMDIVKQVEEEYLGHMKDPDGKKRLRRSIDLLTQKSPITLTENQKKLLIEHSVTGSNLRKGKNPNKK